MKKLFSPFLFVFFLSQILFPQTILAEQKIVQGSFQAHYSVFPSNVISPEIAATYKIKRSNYRGIVNITPQKILDKENNIGIRAKVSGNARNLLGNTQELEFREIIEGDVIYYIAEFSFSNEEIFRFTFNIIPDDSQSENIQLKFQQQFYTE